MRRYESKKDDIFKSLTRVFRPSLLILTDINFLMQWRPMVLPDEYIDHGSQTEQLAKAGLTASHIAATVFNMLGKPTEATEIMSLRNT